MKQPPISPISFQSPNFIPIGDSSQIIPTDYGWKLWDEAIQELDQKLFPQCKHPFTQTIKESP